jgi:hypothetical protein
MGLRARLRRLEYAARGTLVSFELLDGSRFYYNPQTLELFMHWMKCLKAGNPDTWPEPPEAVRKLTEAKDPEAALELISGGAFWLPYDPEALLRERVIRPRSLVAGRDVYDQEVEDLSEPEIREDGF